MANIAIIGAGLGGLPAAYELRHHLSSQHEITLISEKPEFTFIPGLIQVALGLKSLHHVQLNLARLTQRRGIKLIEKAVTGLDPTGKTIALEGGEKLPYDYAVIATGASLNFAAIPGLGPHGGYTQSVCTPAHAIAAKEAWLQFLENPGELVVGAAPEAGCFGPAYEFVLMADWELRRRGLRDKVKITYVTPEPYAGHMGVGGIKNARELTENLLQKRGIQTIDNAAIARVDPNIMTLADGRILRFKYAMVLPAFEGVKFVGDVPRLGNAKGFIPVRPTCKHQTLPGIYALGVSVDLKQPDKTPIAIGLPKSGQMTEAMAIAVARNIAVELGEIRAPLQIPTLEALCFAEFGNTGIAYIAAPVIPDSVTGKRRYSYAVQGAWVAWVKAAFEEYFMYKMRFGAGMPWFEKLGLRALFGLDIVKSWQKPEGEERKYAI
ncbi:MAG: NAD(P)/FAD-dependent oxidoreductase [Spirulina sp.]